METLNDVLSLISLLLIIFFSFRFFVFSLIEPKNLRNDRKISILYDYYDFDEYSDQ